MRPEKIIVVGMSFEALEIYKKNLEILLEKKGWTLRILSEESGIPLDPLQDVLKTTEKLREKDISYLEAVCEFLGIGLESMIKASSVNNKAELFYGPLLNNEFYKKGQDQMQLFKDTCRMMSLERMNYHFELDNASDSEESSKDLADGPNEVMSFIFGDLDYAQINLKIFFNRDKISKIMDGLDHQNYSECRSNEQIDDFMREYSNIMMGGIKRIFEASAPFMSTSLPIIMKDKNGLFLAPKGGLDEQKHIVHRWKIEAKGTDIVCEIHFEIYNPQRFSLAMEHTNFERDDLSNQVFVF